MNRSEKLRFKPNKNNFFKPKLDLVFLILLNLVYICIPAVDIDSILKIDKRLYPQAYLEQYKYKLKKKRNIVNYINDEIIDENSD